ncbi:MAG: DUF6443 domain-containing protein, partial [Prevotellaceae bacterium]|nr:DUF6443 domain-containing protein [Prevotellaceae bacterium]
MKRHLCYFCCFFAMTFLLNSNPNYGQSGDCLPLPLIPTDAFPDGIRVDTIIGSQVIIQGETFQAIGTPSTTLATCICEESPLSTRTPRFQWYKSTDNGSSWSSVSGVKNGTYTPPAPSAGGGDNGWIAGENPTSITILYKRWTGCNPGDDNGPLSDINGSYSNTVSLAIVTQLEGGTISCDTTEVNPGANIELANEAAASGGYGTISYRWEVNSGRGWNSIDNSNILSYQPPAITQAASYRRVVTCTLPIYYGIGDPYIPGKPGFEEPTPGENVKNPPPSDTLILPNSIVPLPERMLVAYSNEITIRVAGGGNDPYPNPNPNPNDYTFSSDHNYILSYTPQIASTDISQVEKKKRGATIVYYDGLGRPMQQIGIVASPRYHDIVTPISYDYAGRQDKDYLPYVASSNHGQYRTSDVMVQQGYYTALYGTADGANAASRRVYEPSPLSRV